MAEVLLLYPNPNAIHPRYPCALLPLAGVLLQNGHHVDIFDEQFQDYKKINVSKYDIVGISILTGPQILNALKIAKWISQKGSSIPLIWGGVHCSLLPEQTAKNEYVDAVVRGEGEETLLEIIDKLDRNKDLSDIKGVTFKRDGEIISNPDREFLDLNTLPTLPYHLLASFHKYSNIQRSIMYCQTSRGCPYNCGFCYASAVHKNRWRSMSADRVIEELRYLKNNFDPSMVAFIDDEFFIDKERVAEICCKIISCGLKIKWMTSGRYDQACQYDTEFFNLLKDSGCTGVSFGGESGSSIVLKSINKRITTEQIKISVKKFKEHNLYSTVNFMAGFPAEKKEDIYKTFDLIDELTLIDPNLMVNSISIYTPFPNTPLYTEALNNGFKLPQSLEGWGEYFYNDVSNLPWLDKKTKGLLRTISLLTECEFNRRGEFKSAKLFKDNLFKRLLYKILSYSAKFRWKHRFFSFPIEWRILDLYFKIIKSGER